MANNLNVVSGAVPASTKASPPAKKKPSSTKSRDGERRATVRPTPIPRTDKKSEALVNMFQLLREGPMQTSQQGVPYKTIVGDPNVDPGYLRPPTQQDIDYGNRLQKAMEQEETGVYPTGWNPVTAEQRITAAERGASPGHKKDIIDPLRREQYGPSTLQNVGGFLKEGYQDTLGKMVPFAAMPGGAIWKSHWRNRPNEALPMRQGNIMRGEGTIADKSRASRRREAEYRHKYYGTPEPGPRESNVYDELGMPQPGPSVPDYDVGQRDVPVYLGDAGARAEQDLGPFKVPPPGSDWGLPAGALALRGLSTSPYLKDETRDLIQGGFPVENLPPGVQRFIKNTMERPETFIDLSGGGPGGTGEKEEGEGKDRFNILKILLGLLGLPFKLLGLGPGEEKKKEKKEGGPRLSQSQRIPWQTENRMNQPSYAVRQKSITK